MPFPSPPAWAITHMTASGAAFTLYGSITTRINGLSNEQPDLPILWLKILSKVISCLSSRYFCITLRILEEKSDMFLTMPASIPRMENTRCLHLRVLAWLTLFWYSLYTLNIYNFVSYTSIKKNAPLKRILAWQKTPVTDTHNCMNSWLNLKLTPLASTLSCNPGPTLHVKFVVV